MRAPLLLWAAATWLAVSAVVHPGRGGGGEQPLSRIAVERAVLAVDDAAHVKASPLVLGLKGENSEWVDVEFFHPNPSSDDWIGVFSPANFSAAICEPENKRQYPPVLCTAPIKYQFANFKNDDYNKTGKGYLKLQLINQREDFSFALFSGGLLKPKLIAVSNKVAFANPKAPVYPRLAQGKSWNEMTVTWTSGYDITEAVPFVEWGEKGGRRFLAPAGTLTFDRNSMCGAPARTVGWCHPGYIHTSYLKDLWPDSPYTYRLGHRLMNGTRVWSKSYNFKASPYPGQDSLQRVIIFGDMGKAEADGSNEFNNFQPGSLNTTNQIISDLENIDMVVHIGDICYANGYLSQWDQFTAQIEPIASTVPYMIGSGNHERDWPGTGSFYGNLDSGGECGVPAQTVFYTPAENRAKFWYATDYGMFRFCIAHTEEDWRPGTEQYNFIEQCLSSVDRQKQPWLIFLAHRVLGYSSCAYYESEGTFEEPMGREALQELWQKYKVGILSPPSTYQKKRSISPSMDTSTAMKGHAQSIRVNASWTRRTTTAARSRRRRTLSSAAQEPASRNSPPQRSSGATSPISTTGSSSSRPSTTRRCCSSTRRAATAMCTTISRSRGTTGTSSLALSTTAPGPHWPHEVSQSQWFSGKEFGHSVSCRAVAIQLLYIVF